MSGAASKCADLLAEISSKRAETDAPSVLMLSRMSKIGLRLGYEERQQLRVLIDDLGEVKAAKHLQIDRLTLARALALLPLRARTHDHLQLKLAEPAPTPAPSKRLGLFGVRA